MLQNDNLQALRRGDLAGARELRLPDGLSEFPTEVFGLSETLEVLDLGRGSIGELTANFGRLRKLRVLFCSGHRFERLPAVLGDCPELSQIGCRNAGVREVPAEALPPRLRWLTLTDNAIEVLPAALGERPYLQKLMLSGNRLTDLPEALRGAENLELIRLAANRFEHLPPWLTECPRLAWIAFAANLCESAFPAMPMPDVPWADLQCHHRLGEGASGRVVEATQHLGGDTNRRVALKLFKGAMTSDGLPEREMAACLAAGGHPGVTGGLGRIVDHPDGVQGLLMRLLPTHWQPLAGPPSRESCSRDVYRAGLRFPAALATRIARRIAEAAAHLHDRGILHGDLYAHNVLWDGEVGNAILSDFGAASALPASAAGRRLARLEVRAWGILFSELLERSECPPASRSIALRDACLSPVPGSRPSMAEVLSELDAPPDPRSP